MLLKMKDAVKQYGEGETRVMALNHADLELEEGELIVIIGPSGSGKSTLLNVLGGLDSLDSGTIELNGKLLSSKNKNELTEFRRSEIGFVFQNYNLISDLTARENIEAVSELVSHPLDVDEVMDTLDIKNLKKRMPREMSGGQQQRVSIARAIVKNPKLLLCDEPTGALDSTSAKTVLKFIEKVNRSYKTTVLIITHNENLCKMADRVIKIKDGKIISNERNDNRQSVEGLEF